MIVLDRAGIKQAVSTEHTPLFLPKLTNLCKALLSNTTEDYLPLGKNHSHSSQSQDRLSNIFFSHNSF